MLNWVLLATFLTYILAGMANESYWDYGLAGYVLVMVIATVITVAIGWVTSVFLSVLGLSVPVYAILAGYMLVTMTAALIKAMVK